MKAYFHDVTFDCYTDYIANISNKSIKTGTIMLQATAHMDPTVLKIINDTNDFGKSVPRFLQMYKDNYWFDNFIVKSPGETEEININNDLFRLATEIMKEIARQQSTDYFDD